MFFVDAELFARWAAAGSGGDGKRGAPTKFADSFVEWLACVRVRTDLTYRALAAFAQTVVADVRARLAEQGFPQDRLSKLSAPHYTQLRRRVAALRLNVDLARALTLPGPRYVLLAVEGVLVTDRHGWAFNVLPTHVSRAWVEARPPAAQRAGRASAVKG